MKIQLSILFVLLSFFISAQSTAEYNLELKNDKIMLEAYVLKADVQTIVQSSQYCVEGTSMSFCLRNYLAQKLEIRIDGSDPLTFTIEASLANEKKLQINLSSDQTFSSAKTISINNNAFVDENSELLNIMSIKQNNEVKEITLDASNRSIELK